MLTLCGMTARKKMACTKQSRAISPTRVHYYVCNSANKGKTKCPVVRVNAEALHHTVLYETVLYEVERAVSHHTVMHGHIAASGGWGNADETQKAMRGQLAKQKQHLEMRIANYVKAIGEGRDSAALFAALDRAEAERDTIASQPPVN